MKLLVAKPLHPRWVDAGLGDSVLYRPGLEALPEEQLVEVLRQHPVDAVITQSSHHQSEEDWRQRQDDRPLHWVFSDEDNGDSKANSDAQAEADLRVLGVAERKVQENIVLRRLERQGIGRSTVASTSVEGAHVSLVGAGIVNLLNSLELVDHGARVDIYDAAPDPRTQPPWQDLGTTHGGGDGRMFCFTEAGNYNEKLDPVNGKIPHVFSRTIQDGGWLAVAPRHRTPDEQGWIDRFLSLPTWKAAVFTEDIHQFTVESAPLWDSLQQRQPRLFEEVGLTQGVLAIYAEAAKVRAAEALHRRLGSLVRALNPEELSRRHPAFRPAVTQRAIGGGLEIRGFTLNVHRFAARLLRRLEERGARFHWNHPVDGIDWTDDRLVRGLRTPRGKVASDHYVLSPGIGSGPLLHGTRSAEALQGVLGLWLHLPHASPTFQHSIKLHREGNVGEDANVILGQDDAGRPSLILGSGYGFLGKQQLDMDSPQIARLFEALEDTARRFFPNAYAAAQQDGSLQLQRKACVRPFSATGLGLFEVLSTDRGGCLIVAGGHNTGGFAQAPIVAQAVTETLSGRSHPMQALYDPQRGFPSSPSALVSVDDAGKRVAEDPRALLQLAGS